MTTPVAGARRERVNRPAWLARGLVVALAAAVGLGLTAVAQQPPAAAPSADKLQAQELSRRAAARIAALQKEADALAARERPLIDEVRRLEVDRDLKNEQYAQGERDLEAIQDELADIGGRIERLEQQSRSQAPALAARIVELYKLGQGGYLRLLLSVDDLRDTGHAYRFVSALQQIDRQRAAEHGRTLADLRTARASLEERRATRLAVQGEVGNARAAAQKAAAAQAAMVQQLDQRRDLAARLMGELQVAQQKLQLRVAELERGAPPSSAAALPLAPFRGDLDWPLDGRVLASFGRQRNDRFNTAVISNGLRIAAAAGTPVHVVHGGTVVFAEPFSGFGNLLIVDHGGQAFTMYGTLASIATPAGTHVSRGQVVGTSGSAIDGTPSLYFELRVDGRPVDPLQWLKKR